MKLFENFININTGKKHVGVRLKKNRWAIYQVGRHKDKGFVPAHIMKSETLNKKFKKI